MNKVFRVGLTAWIIAVVVIIAFVVPAQLTGPSTSPVKQPQKHGAQYFAHRYSCANHTCLPMPTKKQLVVTLKAGKHPIPKLGATGTINLAVYPFVGDQSSQGACAAWATAWYESYLWRIRHPGSSLRFSPRQMYSHYSDTYSGGLDGGSWPDQDAEISSTTGLLRFKQDPLPPYVIDNPALPAIDAWGHPGWQDAAQHIFYTRFTPLQGYAEGAGQGLVDAIRLAISQGHPVFVAFPVYPQYDNATYQPNIVPPLPGQTARGAHSNVALAYDDNRPMPDGTYGAVLVQNQWSTAWGINGRAWMSYSFIRLHVFGSEYAVISTQSPPQNKEPGPIDGGHKLVPPPVGVARKGEPKTGASAWYVKPIYATDRPGYRLDKLFNKYGDQFLIAPLGLAATFGSECGFKTGIDGDCDRVVYPNDISGGGCQITVGTAVSIGVGDGSSSSANIANVFAWEDNPANCVWGEAVLMHRIALYRGATYPLLNVLWNCGPATSAYPVPYGECATNYASFLGWWNYMLADYSLSYKPVPVFPAYTWSSYRTRHRLSAIPYKHGGKVVYGASLYVQYGPKRAGGVVSREQYFKSKHQRGYVTQRFQFRRLYWWPGTTWRKWIVVKAIR